jgi:hypothetical protein
MQKSPLIDPGADDKGLVYPNIALPYLTASFPSQTIGTTGPLPIYLIKPGKKALAFKSA